jgi:hypothetical protein
MTTSTTSRYVRDLVYRLQLRDVEGARIGEIVAEVESHLAESGERPDVAFGPAREYAAQFGPEPAPWWRDPRTVAMAVTAGVGGWLLAGGFFALVFGTGYLGLPAWLVLVAGVLLELAVCLLVPLNPVVDPRRRRPGHFRLAAAAVTLAGYAALLGLGWLLSLLVR